MTYQSLPQEFDGLSHRSQEHTAHLRLWAAVCTTGVEDAATEFKQFSNQKAKLGDRKYKPMAAYEALSWLFDDHTTVGAFVWCCEVFDINPVKARQSWRAKVRSIAARKSWGGNAIPLENDDDS